ncbi:phospholipase D4 [Carlito syrichta]|uniref:spleen exonuclease n=1 Tax=Carlito syrichta TaxID=1868482 RepID=A0A3Q0DVY8_CARSF|nr:phospholipase D4 [Carlito syrichta]
MDAKAGPPEEEVVITLESVAPRGVWAGSETKEGTGAAGLLACLSACGVSGPKGPFGGMKTAALLLTLAHGSQEGLPWGRDRVLAWREEVIYRPVDVHRGMPRHPLPWVVPAGLEQPVTWDCPVQMQRLLQRVAAGPMQPCAPLSRSPQSREASMVQVLGTLAVLWLGTVTVAYLLWQVLPPPTRGQGYSQEVPTRPQPQVSDSSPAWETLKRETEGQSDSCRLVLVESIPQDLPSAAGSPLAQPLAQAWLQLLDTAQESIHVASYYWSLTGPDIGVNDSSSQLGEALLQKLQQLLGRNISLAVATSSPTLARKSTDLQVLAARGAQVRRVPMGRLTGGVLHSKFWVVDGRHIYLGSANMDWRSLTQVKELGMVIYNCSHLAQDLEKTFQTYWVLGAPQAVLPKTWPQNVSSHINRFRPFRGLFDGVPTTAYFSASPPTLCPHGRTRDLDALLAVMGGAREFIYASVMEYFPTTRFSHPRRYWPVLDNALRAAAFARRVHVRLLVSCWRNTDPAMFPYLRSLQALSNSSANISMSVKIFIVPVGNHSNIPFSRVDHSKFMVTEKAAYIGTSNWSEDYFSSTSGVGLVVSQRAPHTQPGMATVQEQLRRLFERDWTSRYAVSLDGQAQGQDCVWRG